ncbi:MAG: phosphatidylglycerol lysyltransferase domain-containing protein, partial [Actinomycetota bacterium]|nr:phosphatidylglycerol lysyltransferase domain-containing protein [Actinomycetota bacterium]
MTTTASVAPLVPDTLDISVPTGARVMVMSDLHLGQNADAGTEIVSAELGRAIEGWDGPGVVVLAGDVFELEAETRNDPARCLRSHPRLASALRRYAEGEGRRVVVLPGNHDAALACHAPAVKALKQDIGAEVAGAVDLEIQTGAGCRKVRIEHGQCDDGASAGDHRCPGGVLSGRHVVHDALPKLEKRGGEWLAGMELLIDPSQSGAFMGSRLLYRRLARRSLVLLLPFVVSAILALVWAGSGRHRHSGLRLSALVALVGGVALLGGILVAAAWWKWALHRPLGALRHVDPGDEADPQNDAPRREARRLVGAGYAGYISGHTHEAELVDLGGAFYANSGCGGSVLERRPGRFGLPAAFAVSRRLSWIELEAGAGLHARLLFGRQPLPSTTAIERICTHPVELGTPRPAVVAAWPNGDPWPAQDHDDLARRKTVRRIGAGLIAFAGLINLASAITPPLAGRLHLITQVVPFAVPQVAAVLVALAGIALLLLSRGVRRGQSHAWTIALFLLTASVLLHVIKGLDFDEAFFALIGALFLLVNKRHFRARVDDQAVARGLLMLLGGAAVAVTAGVAAVEVRWFIGRQTPRPALHRAVFAVAQRLVGVSSIALPHRVDRFLQPTLLATSVGLAVAAGWLLFRPVVASRLAARPAESLSHARRLVEQYGGDTLAYFALRDDKRFFFSGDTLIAYAVYQGVCLVSPDPIGPLAERWVAWAAFRAFADEHGWTVAVMGAGEGWLPVYRSSGMHDL